MLDLNVTTADILTVGPRLVGLTFIWSGAIKSIAPHTFRNHLGSLGWIPWKYQAAAVTAAAGFEVAWGMALLSGIAPRFVYPATVLLLIVFTAISWWGVRSGKAKDCGCYGGYIQPSITQSIALNATFSALVIIAWVSRTPTFEAHWWQAALILIGGIPAALIAFLAQRQEMTTGKLMFDTSPLKVGNTWRHGWADGKTSKAEGETIVAYLGTNCPYCSQFVKVANAIVQSPALPRVIGVIAAPESEVNAYKEKLDIRFPVTTVSQSLMGRLTRAVPTCVIVDSGKIKEMWVGNMPPTFVDRFRDAFFPTAKEHVAQAAN
jgi:hypothetical protein